MRFICGTIAALLICSALTAGQNRSRSFTVEVVDEQAKPVKRACVTLIPREGDIIFGQTDARGRFRVKSLAEGSYRVVVKSGGYSMQKRAVNVSENAGELSFTLHASASWPDARGEQR